MNNRETISWQVQISVGVVFFSLCTPVSKNSNCFINPCTVVILLLIQGFPVFERFLNGSKMLFHGKSRNSLKTTANKNKTNKKKPKPKQWHSFEVCNSSYQTGETQVEGFTTNLYDPLRSVSIFQWHVLMNCFLACSVHCLKLNSVIKGSKTAY